MHDALISRELSWEQTARDTIAAIKATKGLPDCAYTVVLYEGDAALLFRKRQNRSDGYGTDRDEQSILIFDPKCMEATHQEEYTVYGCSTCVAASIAYHLAQSLADGGIPASNEPTDCSTCVNIGKDERVHQALRDGIRAGLAAGRKLRETGFISVKKPTGAEASDALNMSSQDEIAPEIRFPYEFVADAVLGKADETDHEQDSNQSSQSATYQEACVRNTQDWTILGQYCQEPAYSMLQLARQVVTQGVKNALDRVPQLRFGKYVIVDPLEIDGFCSVRRLIAEYVDRLESGWRDKPMSIAVFGPPGCGKSYGVRNMAEFVTKTSKVKTEMRTFNVAQFDRMQALYDAFHIIRDLCLSENLPLVFWDEFDSNRENQPFGWLQYFLSPMQDGTFQQGEVTHHLGPAIFVFAGGKNESFSDFSRAIKEDHDRHIPKGPDFISRLRGYMDVLGPNRSATNSSDTLFVIRRAVRLRSILETIAEQVIDANGRARLDQGVLNAFLQVDNYYHGVRSMEAIVKMSRLAGRWKFEKSALPPMEQLNIHVDGYQFLELARTTSEAPS